VSRYATAAAFRQALEERLRGLDGPIDPKRQFLAIQRLLVRICASRPDVVLKGGLALKLRDGRARATKDLDLRIEGDGSAHGQVLVEAALRTLDDFLSFNVRLTKPLEQVRGHRFRAECLLGGRPFSTFEVDLAPPEPLVGSIDMVSGVDWLSFVGVPTPVFPVYPLASQIAEKLHAMTLPRSRPNTRVKDLPDLALLARLSDDLGSETLLEAIRLTFEHRRTHPIPGLVPKPPEEWRATYARLVEMHSMDWTSLDDVILAVERFLNPILAGRRSGRWSARHWSWIDRSAASS
jgi:hypothetical protein